MFALLIPYKRLLSGWSGQVAVGDFSESPGSSIILRARVVLRAMGQQARECASQSSSCRHLCGDVMSSFLSSKQV